MLKYLYNSFVKLGMFIFRHRAKLMKDYLNEEEQKFATIGVLFWGFIIWSIAFIGLAIQLSRCLI